MDKQHKTAKYHRIYEQLKDLVNKTDDDYARMSTISALLKNKFDHFFWVGFYLLKNDELTVGPYQGSLACLVLEKDKGVCWAGINTKSSVIVPDVHAFAGHIACDSRSNSEIVIPVYNKKSEIRGVLDIDSRNFDDFDDTDRKELEKIVELIYS